MRNKILAVLIAFGFVLTAFTCCSSSAGASPSGGSDQNIFGQVTSIDGSSITLALVSAPNGYPSGGRPSGSRPEGSSQPWPSGQRPQGSFRPRSSGQGGYNGGPYPSGGIRGVMTLSDETKTITIADSTVITKGGMGMGQQDTSPAAASLSDITVGSYLSITMPGDTVTSVVILEFGNRGRNADASPSPSPTVSTSPSPTASPSLGDSVSPGLGLTVH